MPLPSVTRSPFGTLADGTPVARWTLDAGTGVRAEVLDLGGILHRLDVPDPDGRSASVVLGHAALDGYTADTAYLGALIGRYANRIAHGRFRLDGRTHRVPATDRGHALHGGPGGFHRRRWQATAAPGRDAAALRLDLRSPHGDMGFPGELHVTAVYTLDRRGTLRLDWTARTDRPTPVNLTHHAYFNLSGPGSGGVHAHRLTVDADAYLPVDPAAIPLGAPAPTAGTPFDLRTPRPLGERLDHPHPQLRRSGGYDHCYVLAPPPAPGALRRAARLHDPGSRRELEVWTTEPGLQVYTGNGLDGRPHPRHAGLCLETQHFPDSPNRPGYPDTVLRPGAPRRSTTEFRFPHLSHSRAGERT
ncbi:aldose epimerase family protein [Streptomyces sp. TLI_171]|uniref:aldose epimerase family protein n=1 Tax=Streptomyces sp. TLI_171 TaxID=1938859 RepID=UPI000C178FEC|nr:aldose epimerase family protein [Streptomyces sp. TLI_171]RKE23018.1 aldose 1-epimerase [Streptomyces sp. TLI_171]